MIYVFFLVYIFACSQPISKSWKCPIDAVCTKKVRQQLNTAWGRRSNDYKPRTKHLLGNDPIFINPLFMETSTYLRQHAHNPVYWHPWSQETLNKAKREQKPIFLSVGYSTCHWCHVMEEESFEDLEIASFINQNYIAIKVDREERPDVDAIYMQAVYSIQGRGGWPMSVWLNESGEAFYADTYIPSRNGDRGRKLGFLTILQEMSLLYQTEPDRVFIQSNYIKKHIQSRLSEIPLTAGERVDSQAILTNARKIARESFDRKNGGRVGKPKFPSSFPLSFLLYDARSDAQIMLKKTLLGMAQGGIYDQIGGGFHRYSVDATWSVPHFEKMLYDNALLLPIYADVSALMSEPYFEEIARDTMDYLVREMCSEDGGFYSATDADSMTPTGHMEEGYFFTWTPGEIQELFEDEHEQIIRYFSMTDKGNIDGRNTLQKSKVASFFEESWKQKMYDVRSQRPSPLRDDKILSGWNGLTLFALTQMVKRFERERDRQSALKLGRFLRTKMRHSQGLYRSYALGHAKGVAMVEDYASVMKGMIALFEITMDEHWLEEVYQLDSIVKSRFESSKGGWYRTPTDGEQLLVREMPKNDGAEPSGASLMMWNLTRLYALTGDRSYFDRGMMALQRYAPVLENNPMSLDVMLPSLELLEEPAKELIIVYDHNDDLDGYAQLTKKIDYNRVIVLFLDENRAKKMQLSSVQGKDRKGEVTAYLCSLGNCRAPVKGVTELKNQLNKDKLLFP